MHTTNSTKALYNFDSNALFPQGSNAGGGSGGAMWVSCGTFQGSGRVYVNGGSGQGSGGGGAGGRVLIQCESVLFLDENLGGKGMYIG